MSETNGTHAKQKRTVHTLAQKLEVARYVRDHADRFGREKTPLGNMASEAAGKLGFAISIAHVRETFRALEIPIPIQPPLLSGCGGNQEKNRERIARLERTATDVRRDLTTADQLQQATADTVVRLVGRLDTVAARLDAVVESRTADADAVVSLACERLDAVNAAGLTAFAARLDAVENRLAQIEKTTAAHDARTVKMENTIANLHAAFVSAGDKHAYLRRNVEALLKKCNMQPITVV